MTNPAPSNAPASTDGGKKRAPARRAAIRDKPLLAAAILVALLAVVPVVSLFVLATGNVEGVWRHLAVNVLPGSLAITLMLMAGVGATAASIGIGAAWLVSRYDFPGRSFVHWFLVLPLAIPTYISAYCFVELLGFTGPIQTLLRDVLGVTAPAQYWFPDVRSIGGAVFVMGIVLYPYVYLTCRLLFEMQGGAVIEAGRVLGASGARQFFLVALPLARPAVVAGVALAMMETLNDIGAVEILGVRTLTFSIFDTWLNRGSLAGAAQIACMMLVIVAHASLLRTTLSRVAGLRGASWRHRRRWRASGSPARPAGWWPYYACCRR